MNYEIREMKSESNKCSGILSGGNEGKQDQLDALTTTLPSLPATWINTIDWHLATENFHRLQSYMRPDNSVGIATGYGLDGPGIESRWGARFFAHVQTGPGAHPASFTMGTGSFPG
jgi:hypothetical protein